MNVNEQDRKQLLASAVSLNLDVPNNISNEKLLSVVELAGIERHETMTATVREGLREKSEIKRRLTELQVESGIVRIPITIPNDPTLADIVRMEKELGMKKKEPRPSPETIAIEKSKKVYAIFVNREQENLEVLGVSLGGKYRFDFWPDKVHVLPKYLIDHFRDRKTPGGTRPHSELKEAGNGVEARMTTTQRRARFSFEIIGDAPDDAKFGIVTDENILEKLEQAVH